MACFLAPMAVAIFTTAFSSKILAKYQIGWLNMLLWGGVAGLALEHYAHQEIVPYAPFLTAMGSASETMIMLQEMVTVGGSMLVACTAVWLVMLFITSRTNVKTGTKASAQ